MGLGFRYNIIHVHVSVHVPFMVEHCFFVSCVPTLYMYVCVFITFLLWISDEDVLPEPSSTFVCVVHCTCTCTCMYWTASVNYTQYIHIHVQCRYMYTVLLRSVRSHLLMTYFMESLQRKCIRYFWFCVSSVDWLCYTITFPVIFAVCIMYVLFLPTSLSSGSLFRLSREMCLIAQWCSTSMRSTRWTCATPFYPAFRSVRRRNKLTCHWRSVRKGGRGLCVTSATPCSSGVYSHTGSALHQETLRVPDLTDDQSHLTICPWPGEGDHQTSELCTYVHVGYMYIHVQPLNRYLDW